MCKLKLSTTRLAASASVAALLGLSAIVLPMQTSQAQEEGCGPGIGVVPVVNPKVKVHIGDTITIRNVDVGNQSSSFMSSNVDLYILTPDGVTNHVATSVRLAAGSSCDTVNGVAATLQCFFGTNGTVNLPTVKGVCLAYPNTY